MDDLRREFLWNWGLFDLWWRAFWLTNESLIDFIFNEVVVVLIVYLFGLKGLAFSRRTTLSRWLGNTAITLSLSFFGTILAIWLAFFASDPWRYAVRTVIAFVLVKCIFAMKTAFGGWLSLHKRAWKNLKAIIKYRGGPPDEDGALIVELERNL